MNYKIICCGIFISLLSVNISMAASPMEKYLSKIAILESKDGRTFETFEDVAVNLNPFQERNKQYPIVNKENIPEGYVDQKTAKGYFKSFLEHAVLTDEEIEFKDFMNEHFYLMRKESEDSNLVEESESNSDSDSDSNSEKLSDSEGNSDSSSDSLALGDNSDLPDEPEIIKEFPKEYIVTQPGTNTYILCMDSNYEYVASFKEFKPNALSCRDCKTLCTSKCNNGHVYGPNNIYSDFKDTLLKKANIVEAEEICNEKNNITISCVDRTPPTIVGGFPTIGASSSEIASSETRLLCTTGDWFKTPSFQIQDNYENNIFARFSFGRINKCPNDNELWEDLEKWDNPENIVEVENKTVTIGGKKKKQGFFKDVVNFSHFDGMIRYSIFAKEGSPDGKGNLNPGVANIIQDRPEISYGYSEKIDLGNTPDTAKEWPDKRNISSANEKGKDTGFVRILDNDKPNIIIRVTNVETGEQMFFPPCLASESMRIYNSSLYKSYRGKTNEEEYHSFVENLGPDYDYKVIAKTPEFKPYYTIYSIDDKNIKTEKNENNYVHRMVLNNDLKFINQNVRVEDHFYSDTRADGSIAKVHGVGEIGKRNGTFKKMVAMFENSGSFVFQTGVEYKLDVWTDDNVKWSNMEKSDDPDFPKFLVPNAKVYYTGIDNGIIRLDIPNTDEGENLSEEKNIDVSHNVNGDISFTLRKDTPRIRNFEIEEDIEKTNQFPYIYVKVEDTSGLIRELKLYFRVGDKNIDSRILENNKKNKNKK